MWSVPRDLFNITATVAEVDRVVMLADFHDFSTEALSPNKYTSYSNPVLILRRKRLCLLAPLLGRILLRRIPEYAEQV